jgi:hypothetical protein
MHENLIHDQSTSSESDDVIKNKSPRKKVPLYFVSRYNKRKGVPKRHVPGSAIDVQASTVENGAPVIRKTLDEIMDADVIEVDSKYIDLDELAEVLDTIKIRRRYLEHLLTRVDDYEPEQRGHIACVLTETEYLKKDSTIQQLLGVADKLEITIQFFTGEN